MKLRHCAVAAIVALAVATPARAAPQEQAPGHGFPRERPGGHGLVVGGVILVSASLAAYVATAVGLAIGSRAEDDLRSLRTADEIGERKDLLARGQLGNRLAIGAGVGAIALMAAGIPMIVIGRQKAARDQARTTLRVMPRRNGAGAALTIRF